MFTHSVPLLKTDLHCLENSPYRWAFPLINYQLASDQEEIRMSDAYRTKTTTSHQKTYGYRKFGYDFPLSESLENLGKKSDSMDSLDLNNNPVMDSKQKNQSNLNEYDPYAYGFRPLSERNILRTFEVIPGKTSPSSETTTVTTTIPTASSAANNDKKNNKNVTTITYSKTIIKRNPPKDASATATAASADPATNGNRRSSPGKASPPKDASASAAASADPASNGNRRSSPGKASDEVDGSRKSTLKTATKATNTGGDPVRIQSKCDLNYSERAIDVLKEWILPDEKKQDAKGDEKNDIKVKGKPPQPPRLVIPPRTPTTAVNNQSYKRTDSRIASGYHGSKNKNSIYRARSLCTFTDEDVLRLDPMPTKLQAVKCTEFEWMKKIKTKRVDWV